MPYTMKKYKSKKKYHAYKRCVNEVSEKDGTVNPYAVCRASVYGEKKPSKKWVDSPTFNPIRKKKQTGFANLGHYAWEEEKKMTKKQKRESGWD